VGHVKAATSLEGSRLVSTFQSWTRDQLVSLLVEECGIELRGEKSIQTTSLRELAEEIYQVGTTRHLTCAMTTFDELIVIHILTVAS